MGRVYRRTAKVGGASYVTQYNYAAGDTARYGANASTPLVSSVAQTGHVLYYQYDDVGNVTRQTYGGKYTYYVYDTLGQLIRVNDPHDTSSAPAGTTWTYHYDQGGTECRRRQWRMKAACKSNETESMQAERGRRPCRIVDNILSVKRYAHTTGALGPVLEDIPYAYEDANWKDKLTSYNGVAITYDAIGNPVWDGTWTYTWQAGRQLASMGSTGATVGFAYNADGLRIRKTVSGVSTTNYTLHGKNIVHMSQGSHGLHFYYDGSGKVSHVNYNGTMYLYVHNLQGDVIAIRDSTGVDVATYKYDAWGAECRRPLCGMQAACQPNEQRSLTSGSEDKRPLRIVDKPLGKAGSMAATLGTLNPFRYRGYVYDEETGLYYLRSRYYNPAWKRFVNADNAIGNHGRLLSHNLYAYCHNNPVNEHDPIGKAPIAVAAGAALWQYLVGAVIGLLAAIGLTEVIDNINQEESIPNSDDKPIPIPMPNPISASKTRVLEDVETDNGNGIYYFAFLNSTGYLFTIGE